MNGKWKLVRKIGSGSFGEIFLGINVETGEEVAVKLEKVSARHPQLLFESRVYRLLAVGHFFPMRFYVLGYTRPSPHPILRS